MRFIKYTLLTLLLLLCVSAGVALLAPAMIARPLMANYLSASGFELIALEEFSLTPRRALISRITLQSSSLRMTISGAELTYALPELLDGSLKAIAIAALAVEFLPQSITPAGAAPAADSPPLSDRIADALQILGEFSLGNPSQYNLPLTSLHIAAINIRSANTSMAGELQIDTQPLRVAGTLTSDKYAGMLLQINAEADNASGVLSGQANLLQNTQIVVQTEVKSDMKSDMKTLVQTDFTVALNSDILQLETTAAVNVAALQSLITTPSTLSLGNTTAESLNFTLALTAADLSTAPSLSQIDIQLDSPDHSLQVDFRDEPREGDLQLQLPLHLTGSMAALDQSLQFNAENQLAKFTMTDGDTQVQGEVSLLQASFGCTLIIECATNLSVTAQFPQVRIPGVIAQDIGIAITMTMAANANGFVLSIPELELQNSGPSLRLVESDTTLHFAATTNSFLLNCDAQRNCAGTGVFQVNVPELGNATWQIAGMSTQGTFTLDASASGVSITVPGTELAVGSLNSGDATLSGTMQLSDLSASLGTEQSLSFALATQQFDLGFADMQLVNPSINGTVRYTNDSLQTTLNLALANQLQAKLSADYDLATATGMLDWEIPEYYFSAITPASRLVTYSSRKIDIISGSVAGSGEIAVSANPPGNWQFDGPLTLNLNDISGFVDDMVFVELNSQIRAAVSDNGNIHTPEMLSARLATLDVGLPLTDIRWNYGFGSAAQNVTFKDVTMNTLGGAITLADFSYDIRNPDSKLTLVLTNLNLQSIVDLAEYPGITVEGLISGYLPLALKGQKITVEKGLIGALQPGGTIRYDSGSPVATGNSSLDLLNQALANYHYQIMNTYVYYNENGDLRLEVQLLGNNPDLYNGQMVNLNVNIDDNIPALLRSLQASRTITDALELHLQNQQSDRNVNQ